MWMNGRVWIALAAGFSVGLVASVGGTVLADRDAPAADTLPWEDARLFAEVLERVKTDYVDEVDEHKLMEGAVRGMIAQLDPHSAFLDSDEYREIRISTTGNYSGVGPGSESRRRPRAGGFAYRRYTGGAGRDQAG